MKILFIHNRYLQPGGEDVAVAEETQLIQEKGHMAEVIYFNNTSTSSGVSKIKAGINAVYNQQSFTLITRAIKNFQPDVIHVHNLFFTASPSVLYAAKQNNIPVIATLHNYRLICANALLMKRNVPCELCVNKTFPLAGILNKCYHSSAVQSALVTAITGTHKISGAWRKKVHTYIALTSFAKEKILHSSLKIPESNIIVKPNFIKDYGEGKQPRENFFLFAGRLSVEKGTETALNAFAQLPHCNLVISGDGPERKRMEEQFKSFTNIRFTGLQSREEVLLLMKKCRALVFPSVWYEGLPYIILEAFATGTPVIASKLGAMESVITHQYNGLHFLPGNSNDLISAVTAFITHPAPQNFYSNARKTYLSLYHPDIHYKEIMKIYSDAIKSRL